MVLFNAKSRPNQMARNPSMSVQQLLQRVIDAVATDPNMADAVKRPLVQACQNAIAWMNGPERDTHPKSQGLRRTIADGPNWKENRRGPTRRDGGSHDVSGDLQRQIR